MQSLHINTVRRKPSKLYKSYILSTVGCVGWMAAMPETVAVPGAHLLLRWHQPAAAHREQALPDHGATVEEDHEECQGKPTGKRNLDERLSTLRLKFCTFDFISLWYLHIQCNHSTVGIILDNILNPFCLNKLQWSPIITNSIWLNACLLGYY